jgi:hypothetical protein
MQLMGVNAPDVPAKLDDAHAYIRAKVPNFRTYTSWGHDEAIIGGYYDAVLAKNALDNRGRPHVLDRFYTRQTNGVRFLDWFTAAVTGKPVEDVACVDCETPEHHWTRPAFPRRACHRRRSPPLPPRHIVRRSAVHQVRALGSVNRSASRRATCGSICSTARQ